MDAKEKERVTDTLKASVPEDFGTDAFRGWIYAAFGLDHDSTTEQVVARIVEVIEQPPADYIPKADVQNTIREALRSMTDYRFELLNIREPMDFENRYVMRMVNENVKVPPEVKMKDIPERDWCLLARSLFIYEINKQVEGYL